MTAIPVRDSDCLLCHEDRTLVVTNARGLTLSLYVDAAKLKGSVHKTNACGSCHSDLTDRHPDDNVAAKPVDCAACHQRYAESYAGSVHALALAAGDQGAPTCKDCHGAHDVLPPPNPESPLHFLRISATCGNCHDQEAAEVDESVHGRAVGAGRREAATCIDCHSEHRIEQLKTNASLRVSTEVCSRCHASERINTKFNLPKDRVTTFFESYHGLASKYGSTLAANCASCHGYHLVLPSSNPRSTINTNNLVATCGKCHPGATENFAWSKIHVDLTAAQSADDIGSRVNWWVRRVYLVLIVGVVGTMLAHNFLLLVRKVSAHLRAEGRPILRMNLTQRWQHAVLAVSFIVLAVTGFALKFPDSWVSILLGSSEPFRRWAHRVAGVVLLLVGLYHLIYIMAAKDGRKLIKDLLPLKKDVADVAGATRYLLGVSANKPKVGRFGYSEKLEYWAVVWGTIIMGVTGLLVWFKMDVTQWLPRWAVDVALTIHYYEAILACLAIVVWHFYHVIFDPDVYPLNTSCWDGKVTAHWQAEEHPLEQPVRTDETPVPVPPMDEENAPELAAKAKAG